MMSVLRRLGSALWYRTKEVAVSDCVHYCGFRYARGDFNPYERYVRGLASREPVASLRRELLDFLLRYRPRHLGDALSVDVERPPPLWRLPWNRVNADTPRGWREDPREIPDVLTHFCDRGVPESVVLSEHGWLEGAWASIAREGYRPEAYSYIRVFELRGAERSAYIVADGNHRVASLSVAGVARARVKFAPLRIAHRARVEHWPAVRNGEISVRDALTIFDAYFAGNHRPHRADHPAELIPADT